MSEVTIKKINEVFMSVTGEPSALMNLSEYFTFTVPNYRFTPQYRFGGWDGKIRLYNAKTNRLYTGLHSKAKEYLESINVNVISEGFEENKFSAEEAYEFASGLNTVFKIKPHQLKAFLVAIRKKRVIILSPTASGKSFIMYNIAKYLSDKNILIIENTINLVNQIANDFIEYDKDKKIEAEIYKITGGVKKQGIKQRIVVSTWQSVVKQPKSWFDKFDAIIGDEVHIFNAKSLKDIMHKLEDAEYRIGVTGTLEDTQTHRMTLEGLFGPIITVAKTNELIAKGDLANLKIKCIRLNYDRDFRKLVKKGKYHDEKNFLFDYDTRNKYLKNLCLSIKGNTLIIFTKIDHGKKLHEIISNETDHPTYLIYGGVDGDERERIRKIVNTHENSITVASMKTFSTGVNIPNLNNIIFAAPTKSTYNVMQSIGRGLRVSPTKDSMVLYDIVDDFTIGNWQNYAVKHYNERIKMYVNENFKFKEYSVELK